MYLFHVKKAKTNSRCGEHRFFLVLLLRIKKMNLPLFALNVVN